MSAATDDAALAAALFAADPVGTGGVCLHSRAGPARDQWLVLLRELLPANAPLRRIPFNIAESRLLGGLDLVATLKANRPIAERGVLAASDGGVVVLSMAERLTMRSAACLGAVLDAGEIILPREGVFLRHAARVGIVALDEGMAEDEFVPHSLLDRLAFMLDLDGVGVREPLTAQHDFQQVVAARELLPRIRAPEDILEMLCGTALALGAGSLRVSLLAFRAARAAAALEGRTEVTVEDAILAGRLVIAPRASLAPPPAEARSKESSADAATSDSAAPQDGLAEQAKRAGQEKPANQEEPKGERTESELDSRVLAATQAAIPPGLLARIKASAGLGRRSSSGPGRTGAVRSAGNRGRPAGVRVGSPHGNARLNVIETLRAAAPWQPLRGRPSASGARLRIEAGDFRVTRYKQRARTLTIFAVDASGSSALNRLAEAKGAVELLLAECYIRRDQVAVIAFRGRAAELMLPPTRSLLRAKRGLAGLPGGGGTPLAAALEAAVTLAVQAQRRGETPTLVLLTDGRANVARDGAAGREAAHRDALSAARTVHFARLAALFIDTSPRPSALAGELAAAMRARYVPLPFANSRALSDIVAAATVRS